MRRRYVFVVSLFIFALAAMILAGCSSSDSPTDPNGGGPRGSVTWYVDTDATGTGDGLSWGNAFNQPADAMAEAISGDKIWVASGTYYGPGSKSDPVVAFKAGVKLYGGFDGTETDLSQRSLIDRAVFDGGDTLYHVVTGADNALLHGFEVKSGSAMATGTTSDARGGGIYCFEDKFRISNCVIEYNEARYGGGIYAEGDTVVIDSCTIHYNNVATLEGQDMSGGGGIYVKTADALIADCTIDANTASQKGGGLLLLNSMVTASDLEVFGNSTGGTLYNGGGMYVSNEQSQSISPAFTSCRFASNTGGYGGAVHLYFSSVHFTECEFENNVATMTGSALNTYRSSYQMEQCNIDENERTAIYNYFPLGSTTPRIFNCLFTRNGHSSTHGGAIANNQVDTEIECCTITGNTASDGGGIWSSGDCSPVVNNCIIWGNTVTSGGAQVHDTGGATTIVTYTDIDQDGYDGAGLFNIRLAPLFVTGPRGDYYLSHTAAGQGANSPCIDIGSGTAVSYFLHTMTTRTDDVVDAAQVDLGFHYELDD